MLFVIGFNQYIQGGPSKTNSPDFREFIMFKQNARACTFCFLSLCFNKFGLIVQEKFLFHNNNFLSQVRDSRYCCYHQGQTVCMEDTVTRTKLLSSILPLDFTPGIHLQFELTQRARSLKQMELVSLPLPGIKPESSRGMGECCNTPPANSRVFIFILFLFFYLPLNR